MRPAGSEEASAAPPLPPGDARPDEQFPAGLSAEAVAERRARGLVNRPPAGSIQRPSQIVARNTFTWINLIFAVLGAASLSTGAGPDATFLAIAVINTVVGSVEEIRAKRKLEALSIINAPRAHVLREGTVQELAVADVVLDDVLEVRRGDQVVADAVIAAGHGEVDESLVTGESEPVRKAPGDALLSGSWVVSGWLRGTVTAVGEGSYAGGLASEARRYTLTGSELVAGINTILRRLAVIMLLVAPPLLVRQLQVQPWRLAVRSTVAALVGMVPEGLVLLTTLAFVTGAVRLGRSNVLVQQLPAVETLARVDVLCTDKTGTLTDGHLEWRALVTRDPPGDADGARQALAALADTPDTNATLAAIASGAGPPPPWHDVRRVPFSSERKWSAATFEGRGTWVLGAPEIVAGDDPAGLRRRADALAATGSRVLVLAHSPRFSVDDLLPPELRVEAVVELAERLRPDAAATLGYFGRQHVAVRVLSGDSPATVGAVASQAGLESTGEPVDARRWPPDEQQRSALIGSHAVFGRVTPAQKREMVDALHADGHVVAMTGDGVNDTIALKEADLGIAMGSGSDVARGVAQIVLLDNRFSVLPSVVSEGRRVLHNVERVATLFLVKNVYSIVISVAVSVAGWPYPFLPRHMSLISGLGIGIPAFFLAFAPSDDRFQTGFVRRVVKLATMIGGVTAATVLLTYALAREESTAPDQARTAAMIVTIVVSLWVLVLAARPLRPWKVALVLADAGAFAATFFTPGVDTFFSLTHRPSPEVSLEGAGLAVAACALVTLVYARATRRHAAPGPPPRARRRPPPAG